MKNAIMILLLFWHGLAITSCGHRKIVRVAPFQQSVVQFRFDSAVILEKYRRILSDSLGYLRDHPQAVMVLEGHTDKIGGADYNLDLGDRRARAVRGFMIAGGVAPERLVPVTYGEEQTRGKHRENRRVVIRNAAE